MQELHIEIRCCHSNILIPRPLHKLKNALFVAPESDRLSFACVSCICSDLLNEHQELITLLKGGEFWLYPLGGKGLEPIVFPWKCHKGNGTKDTPWNFVMSITTAQSFSSINNISAEIFLFLWFYIILCQILWRHK